MSDNICNEVLTHTNTEMGVRCALYKNETDGSIKDLNLEELDAFFGILVLSKY